MQEMLQAGLIIAGWDEVKGGSVWGVPLGGTLVEQPFTIGSAFNHSAQLPPMRPMSARHESCMVQHPTHTSNCIVSQPCWLAASTPSIRSSTARYAAVVICINDGKATSLYGRSQAPSQGRIACLGLH